MLKTKVKDSEWEHKVIALRRVTRVVRGGRRFSFSAVVVMGNRRGEVGLGIAKGGDVAGAVEKSLRQAKKALFRVPLTPDNSLPHEVKVKYSSARLLLQPSPGRGLVAGSSLRTVLELAGVTNVSAKIFSKSKNKLNNARAGILALKQYAIK